MKFLEYFRADKTEAKVDNARDEKLVSALQYTIGERERLKALWALAADCLGHVDADDLKRLMSALLSSPSERHQDAFALLITRKFSGGFFVEFGACDGFASSNTYLLEKEFGWTGILSEPGRVWHSDLKKNRAAVVDTRCVAASSGETVEFNEGENPIVSSLDVSHRYLGDVRSTYSVETVSLNELLDTHNAPRHIDFLSVDVEGGELEALKNLDFEKYSFEFVCVEQHRHVEETNDVSGLFRQAGYEILFPRDPDRTKPPHMQVSGDDLFFVPRDSVHLASK